MTGSFFPRDSDLAAEEYISFSGLLLTDQHKLGGLKQKKFILLQQ